MNATQSPATDQTTNDSLAKAAAAKAAQHDKLLAKIKEERTARDEAYKAYVKASQAIRIEGLKLDAIATGHSVTSVGRPGKDSWGKLMTALVEWQDEKGQPLSFKQRDELYRIASKAVGQGEHEGAWTAKNDEELAKVRAKFVKSVGKADANGASCTLRMATPGKFAIALGE